MHLIFAFVAFAAAANHESGGELEEGEGRLGVHPLREDATATEYLVRYPGGHVFSPHWRRSTRGWCCSKAGCR